MSSRTTCERVAAAGYQRLDLDDFLQPQGLGASQAGDVQAGLEEVVDQILFRSPWTILSIGPDCLPSLAALPMIHRDAFDRLLIAQARQEGMVIVTADEQIKRYDVRTIW